MITQETTTEKALDVVERANAKNNIEGAIQTSIPTSAVGLLHADNIKIMPPKEKYEYMLANDLIAEQKVAPGQKLSYGQDLRTTAQKKQWADGIVRERTQTAQEDVNSKPDERTQSYLEDRSDPAFKDHLDDSTSVKTDKGIRVPKREVKKYVVEDGVLKDNPLYQNNNNII